MTSEDWSRAIGTSHLNPSDLSAFELQAAEQNIQSTSDSQFQVDLRCQARLSRYLSLS